MLVLIMFSSGKLKVESDALDPALLNRVRSLSHVEKPTQLRRDSSKSISQKPRSKSQPLCDFKKSSSNRSDSPAIARLQLSSSRLKEYRMVVLGSGHVGKSALVQRFIHNDFPYSYQPTVEECYSHIVQLPSK